MKESKSALKKFAIQYRIDGKDGFNPTLLMVNAKQSITNRLINRRQYKVKLILSRMMEKIDLTGGEVISKEAVFHSKTEVNLESTNFNELFPEMKETVLESLAKFQRQESNLRFRSLLRLDLHTVKYEPLGGSFYIPLSDFLAAKKAIINLKDEDDECFKWAITRALNPVENIINVLIENLEKNQRSSIGRV